MENCTKLHNFLLFFHLLHTKNVKCMVQVRSPRKTKDTLFFFSGFPSEDLPFYFFSCFIAQNTLSRHVKCMNVNLGIFFPTALAANASGHGLQITVPVHLLRKYAFQFSFSLQLMAGTTYKIRIT